MSERPEQIMSNKLFVSFSKRRRGLFNKAGELCKLCHAQVAVIVLSPTGNPFAFGHSSVEEVLHRYFLRQTRLMNNENVYQCPRTTAFRMTEKHRHQVQQLEGLKARIKQAENRESTNNDDMTIRSLKAWIEKESASCKTVEELEFLKQKYLALLDNVRSRIGKYSSSSSSPLSLSSGEGKIVNNNVETKKYLITSHGFEYGSSQLGIHHSLGSVGTDSSSYPRVVGPGEYCSNTDVNNDVLPLVAIPGSRNEMSFKYPVEDFEPERKRLKTCYGSGSGTWASTHSSNYSVEEGVIFDNYVLDFNDHDQYLLSSTGFNGVSSGFNSYSVGMAGDTGSGFFLPQNLPSGDYYADLYCGARPLAVVMNSMNDVSNSMDGFGHHDRASSSYSTNHHQMVEVSNDQVFNFPWSSSY